MQNASLSYHSSLRSLFCLFLSDCLSFTSLLNIKALRHSSSIVIAEITGFIQASLGKIKGLFKDF